MPVFKKSFCLFCWLASFKKETKLKRSHARIRQTVLLLQRVFLKVARTYLYALLGYMFLNRVSRQERFNWFLWFLAPLIKNGGTLRKWYLFSCRLKNDWDIGIFLKPSFYKKLQKLRNSTTDFFSLTSAKKPQNSLVLYLQVWSQSWP